LGDLSKQLEWVTGHSCRAGINGRLKPLSGLSASAQDLFGGKQASGAGTVKLVMRPVWCMSQANGEVMVSDKDRFWGIFPCSGSRLNLEPVSRDCAYRSPPHTLLETCPDAIVAIDALQHAIANVHKDQPRKKTKEMHNATYGRQNVLEIALRILEECRGRHHTSAASSSTPRRSTLWTADLQRVAGPSDIMRGMCPCAHGAKFPKWLYYDCGIGHFIVSRNTVFMSARDIIPAILHNLKFQILSQCRTQPIDMPNIMRGVIDETELGTLRVAGTAAAFMSLIRLLL
jgi:hypothetical protein